MLNDVAKEIKEDISPYDFFSSFVLLFGEFHLFAIFGKVSGCNITYMKGPIRSPSPFFYNKVIRLSVN